MLRTIPFVSHLRVVESIEAVKRILPGVRPGTILWVIGPSGVGKSEVRQAILPFVGGNPEEWLQGTLPFISVRAMANDRGRFNSKDLALRMHLAITDPDFTWMRPESMNMDVDSHHARAEEAALSEQWLRFRESHAQRKIQNSFESQAKSRGLRYIFVEEAGTINLNHLIQSNRGHMENLIRMIEEINCVLVMFGTHYSSRLWLDNTEVFTRSQFYYVNPYDVSSDDGQKRMQEIAKALSRNFPLRDNDLVLKNFDLFLLNCAGVFGHALAFLERANNARKSEGGRVITQRHLEAGACTRAQLETIWLHVNGFNRLVREHPVTGSAKVADVLREMISVS